VCGDVEAWGDFIVPVASAHLPGAINVDLDGIFHSPLGAKLPFLGCALLHARTRLLLVSPPALLTSPRRRRRRPWYGSPGVVDRWLHHLTDDQEALGRPSSPRTLV
jgi:hypothetical protein